MRFNIKAALMISSILLLIATFSSNVSASGKRKPRSLAEAAGLSGIPKIRSESGIIVDAESGAVLLAKNENKKQYPASITKVMTVLLALENGDPQDKILCSRKAVTSIEPGSSHIGIKPGEELVVKDALHGILLASANEISNCIGEYVAGDMKNFAELMTKRAKALGCRNTSFKNASGLHDDEHYTTAYDMALIVREAMKHELFRKIVTTTQAYIPKTNITDVKRYLSNSNKLILKKSPYYYEKCTGGKTGFTQRAWHTLVNSADDGDMKLISAVLRSQGRPDKWTDTISWFDYCYEHFRNIKLDSEEGDKGFKKLREFELDGEPLIQERSVLTYVEDNASVTLPKDAEFSDLVLKAKLVEDRGDRRLIQVTYTYEDFIAGSCYVDEDLSFENSYHLKENYKRDSTDKGIKADMGTKVQRGGGGFLAISLVLLLGSGFVIFILRKKNFSITDLLRGEKKKKFSFDKSLFKRH